MRLRGTKENVLFALKAIRDHKLRSALTVVGIVVGIMTVITMVSVLQGFNDQVMADFTRFGSTLVQFQKYESRSGGPGTGSARAPPRVASGSSGCRSA